MFQYVVAGLLVGGMVVHGETRAWWSESTMKQRFDVVSSFCKELSLVPETSSLREHPDVRKAVVLCDSAKQLFKAGKERASLKLLESNEEVLDQACELIYCYRSCESYLFEAAKLVQLIDSNELKPLYEAELKALQSMPQRVKEGGYEETHQIWQQAEKQCRQKVRSALERAQRFYAAEAGLNWVRLGGVPGERLADALEQAQERLKKNVLLDLLKSHQRILILQPQAQQKADVVQQQLKVAFETEQEGAVKLAMLSPYLKQKPPLPFAEHLKRAYLANQRFKTGQTLENMVGVRMAFVPADRFLMGDAAASGQAIPHQVTIRYGFFIGCFEVTRSQWEQVMNGRSAGFSEDAHLPKNNVSWEEAQAFCAALSRMEPGRRYRLPTEAEWEYACRAGTSSAYNTGKDQLTGNEAAVFDLQKPLEAAVTGGHFSPNAWGLYDMHGNLAEWCLDWMAPLEAESVIDPRGPADGAVDLSFAGRIVRGGSWFDDAAAARSSARHSQLPIIGTDSIGFRIVLEADSVEPL